MLCDICEWNTNLATPACVDRTCTTASSSTTTHNQCINHNGTNSCTVAAVAGIPSNTLGGCIPLGACSQYIDQEQCLANASLNACAWTNSGCADKAYTTAAQTNTTDSACQTYLSGCTVDQSDSGCMAILSTCESYQIQANCVIDTQQNDCYWNSTTSKCVTKTCDNAPNAVASATDCSNYLSGCKMDSIKQNVKLRFVKISNQILMHYVKLLYLNVQLME